jgi:hypothetical protein
MGRIRIRVHTESARSGKVTRIRTDPDPKHNYKHTFVRMTLNENYKSVRWRLYSSLMLEIIEPESRMFSEIRRERLPANCCQRHSLSIR